MREKPDGKVDLTDYLRKIGQPSRLGKFVSVPIPWDSAWEPGGPPTLGEPAGPVPVYLGSGTLPPVNPEIARLRAENEAMRWQHERSIQAWMAYATGIEDQNALFEASLRSALCAATTLAETLAAVLRAGDVDERFPKPAAPDLVAAVTRDHDKGWMPL